MEDGIKIQNPKISFIIPAYKCEKTIVLCLESILSNKNVKYEIIVVMDGRDEKLKSLISKYNVIIYQIEKSGPAAARNYGARKASGEILFFLDSDVILNPNALNESIKIIDKGWEKRHDSEEKSLESSPQILQGMFDILPANPSISTIFASIKKWIDYNPNENKTFTTVGSAIFIIKRKIFQEFGGFSEEYSSNTVEDYEFGHRLAQKYEIILCPNITGKHHFPRFGKLIKNYITRTKEWGALFSKSKKFDTGAANKKAALTTGLTGILWLFILNFTLNQLPNYDLFASGTILFLLFTLVFIISLNLKLLMKFAEIKGVLFTFLGFFMFIILHTSIIIGFILLIYSMIISKFKKGHTDIKR